jgi:hypothetical protein
MAGGGFVCFGGRGGGCVPLPAGAPRGGAPTPGPAPSPTPAPSAVDARALRAQIAALTERLPAEVPLRTGELVPRAEAVAAQLAWAGEHPGKLARALASVRALAGPPPPAEPSGPYAPPPATWDVVREACDRLGAHAGAAFAGWVSAVQKRTRTLAEAAALATALADADEHYRARLGECRTAEEAAGVLKTASKDPRIALDKGELARLRAVGFGWGAVSEATWPKATDDERAAIQGEGLR